MLAFNGKTIFITGASSGIGATLAQQLAAAGADLVLAARRTDKLDALAAPLRQPGRSIRTYACDVTQPEQLQLLVQDVVTHGGKIDIVIANAGFGVSGKIQNLTTADYRRQFDTNVFGVLNTVYATLAQLKQQHGQLVLIGSVAGYVSLPGASAYAMSKFALRALADAIRQDLSHDSIDVTLISPGFVDSDIRRTDNLGRVHEHIDDPIPRWVRVATDKAVHEIIHAIHRRKREQIVTGHGKMIVLLSRLCPWMIRAAFRFGLRSRPEPR